MYVRKISIVLFLICGIILISAQKDSIKIKAKLSTDLRILEVTQEMIYHNRTQENLHHIKLLNWVAAYNKRGTSLVDRKLEDRNNKLHFAPKEDLGKILNFNIDNNAKTLITSDTSKENIFITLTEPLSAGKSTKLILNYKIQLPHKKFTGYGSNQENALLKYFFIVPDHFDIHNKTKRDYLDIEETVNFNTYWDVNFTSSEKFSIQSNLQKVANNSFKGFLNSDPEFIVSKNQFPILNVNSEDIKTEIQFGYELNAKEIQNLEFYLPLQLRFLKDRIGNIPERLFISEKFKAKEDFFGNNDIQFWKFRFKLFTDAENTDLDYFGIITKKILDENIIADKEDHHWFKNGIKTYLEIQYLTKFYSDKKLLGDLPETSILGIKPLKFFHASKVKLLDRYGLAYQYIMPQNLDQKIDEPYSALSNFNDLAISNFEMGSLFNYSAEKMGVDQFNYLLKNYLVNHKEKAIQPNEFLDQLSAKESSTSYLKKFIEHKNRVNFKLKKFKLVDDNLSIRITKNTDDNIPVKLDTETKNGEKASYWIDTQQNERLTTFNIPAENIYKITLNNNYIFPESSYSDNFLYTKGLFSNARKIKFKLIKDIPNPEFNEIYLNPRIRFSNTYDKFLIGMNFKNQSLFDQKFLYSFTPYYSTGTKKLTGSGAISYSFLPAESIIQRLSFGVSGSYFHYDYNLAYLKNSASVNISFRKDPRSTVSRGLGISYTYFERELNAKMIADQDYDRYNLWTVGYGYSDNKMIHEKSFSLSAQGMEDYNKITAEGFYRWEFAPRQKLSLRLFAGYFARNETRNNTFNYGISRVSDYSFSYNLLGQSATSGVLSQQYVLADGGFKSFIPGSVNHWITSFNLDTSVWKIFHVYADAGVYKNKNTPTKFIWDSGVKVRVIPDFLEIFLPVQSSLGFEPGFKDYAKRIRYTLVLNLSTIINAARRGWY